jgi:hypothetical protein
MSLSEYGVPGSEHRDNVQSWVNSEMLVAAAKRDIRAEEMLSIAKSQASAAALQATAAFEQARWAKWAAIIATVAAIIATVAAIK